MTGSLLAVVAVAAGITVALRAAPFALGSSLRSSPLVTYLSRHLPAGILVILVIYLLRDVPLARPAVDVRELAPVVVTALVQVWRRTMLLSIAAGVATYAALLALVPG